MKTEIKNFMKRTSYPISPLNNPTLQTANSTAGISVSVCGFLYLILVEWKFIDDTPVHTKQRIDHYIELLLKAKQKLVMSCTFKGSGTQQMGPPAASLRRRWGWVFCCVFWVPIFWVVMEERECGKVRGFGEVKSVGKMVMIELCEGPKERVFWGHWISPSDSKYLVRRSDPILSQKLNWWRIGKMYYFCESCALKAKLHLQIGQ